MNITATPETPISTISPAEAQKRNGDALLLDVRTPAEFEEAHIDGSVLHPLGDLNPEEVKQLAAGKSACFLICRSGNRARQAAEKLKSCELEGLRILEGGVQAWDAAGLPLSRGTKTMSLERQVRIAAGTLVFTGAMLGYFVHPAWIALPAFVGTGLVFAGITDTCGMGMLIARMPWNNRRGPSGGSHCTSPR
ncbi:MAG: rhodanese-like domain-containing protein [Terrimicrobiaceae bacterium]|nr:rhodanese-like domain-containing protein [Terrimicrobiaceae bacterium]